MFDSDQLEEKSQQDAIAGDEDSSLVSPLELLALQGASEVDAYANGHILPLICHGSVLL